MQKQSVLFIESPKSHEGKKQLKEKRWDDPLMDCWPWVAMTTNDGSGECVDLEDELHGARFFKLQKIQILNFKKNQKSTRV
jgi:hypothetical protein